MGHSRPKPQLLFAGWVFLSGKDQIQPNHNEPEAGNCGQHDVGDV